MAAGHSLSAMCNCLYESSQLKTKRESITLGVLSGARRHASLRLRQPVLLSHEMRRHVTVLIFDT